MRKKTKTMLLSAIAALGLANAAHASPMPIVNLNLILDQATVDPINGDSDSGIPVPQYDGVDRVDPGSKFFVILEAGITPGTENYTGTQSARSTATRNKPLGISF